MLIVCFIALITTISCAKPGKHSSTVAIPTKKSKNVGPIGRTPFGSLFHRAFREIKVTFVSELEASTLQVCLHFSVFS